MDAAGTLFVSVSPGPAVNDYLSETVGTVEVATGAVTVLGTVQTLQNDVDAMTLDGDGDLLALDGDVNTGQRAVYTIDPANGAASHVATFDSPLISIAYSRWLDRMFAYRLSANRDLVELDLSDSTLTDIGTIHTEADFGGSTLAGLFFAPEPSCL